MTFQIISKHGHVELYINGTFYCSADTVSEAVEEYNNYMERRSHNENKNP